MKYDYLISVAFYGLKNVDCGCYDVIRVCHYFKFFFFLFYSHLNSTIENREDWAQRISLKHTILMLSIGRVHAR